MNNETDKYNNVLTILNIILPIILIIIIVIATNILSNMKPVRDEYGATVIRNDSYIVGNKVAIITMITGTLFSIITIVAPFVLKSNKKVIHIVPTLIILLLITYTITTIYSSFA